MKSYLLVGAMPTPNGGLHLGHLAAQFLPLDIFARYQRRQGHRVGFYGGFDVYDNAISVIARAHGVTPQAMALRMQAQIQRELGYFHIELDALINYLAPEQRQQSLRALGQATQQLAPWLQTRQVRYPFTAGGAPIAGNWIGGRCKYCGEPAKGYSCDTCGISITPEDFDDIHITAARQGEPIQWQAREVLYVAVPEVDLNDYLAAQPLPAGVRQQCRVLAGTRPGRYQWTGIDDWGLFLPGQGPGQVFFNRNFTLIEQLLIGERFERQHGQAPFRPHSPVHSILAYGKDNAGLLLMDLPHIALATGLVAPYRRHWVSPFYQLAGRKMSTGQQHALWLAELMAESAPADATRLYLSSQHSAEHDVELSLKGLHRQARLYRDLLGLIARLRAIGPASDATRPLCAPLAALAEQVHALFEQPLPAWQQYHALLADCCRLGAGIDGAHAAQQWLATFARCFGALVPDAATLAEAR
ncbi:MULTISPECIES: class I tRNA ligase family protein [unclassified Pseudomonas]|uniref:class I tRNA ligase family protein n=1 Tax=unclassified Pseudomonas TaxID=196821 RepID=UPI000BC9F714|nr:MULTISPECIES: class I tRNA ligase family protein [unclassified Pseudomonas]PVZ13898.1 methionyl-tRNA synthetase [Pseudomonas sp. URIL14HWK12:I12]PVZ24204.1 methionyl-tRNA synthetase [Pseudomonas sp. URIL14HWK12:I10]PVZ33157.1 methionyl-tRNA synthetase [Pseudomonas sp. URIL14HWK12:I11]SNZ10553.1 Methionyl-tRNA synthetase [Pseudomonas sp. URIL14HWK12:I9]